MVDGCKAVVSTPVEFVPVSEAFLQKHHVGSWTGPGTLPLWIPSGPNTVGYDTVNNAKALKLGCTFRPLADTAKSTLDWYLATQRGQGGGGLRGGLSAKAEIELIDQWRTRRSP